MIDIKCSFGLNYLLELLIELKYNYYFYNYQRFKYLCNSEMSFGEFI